MRGFKKCNWSIRKTRNEFEICRSYRSGESSEFLIVNVYLLTDKLKLIEY